MSESWHFTLGLVIQVDADNAGEAKAMHDELVRYLTSGDANVGAPIVGVRPGEPELAPARAGR